ncbi:hypothetical protein CORC01_02081 [Colletotrichum orchidophilum]|uniref:Subtilisin-like serine protease n=1 Tax=Colletotrichum orchidophilum TaxID=1209926 RepID=A0A1G4BMY0_9PEZI|nr:uncharacterized protein CORC01_02081 [Colletotrichum orchidophilum]OHF02685.1 hypothetical protein CORC01_02081 [Colletotrichum orchidophilum]
MSLLMSHLAPFSQRVLQPELQAESSSSHNPEQVLRELLPASERDSVGRLSDPAQNVSEWLGRELNLDRLTNVFDSLWFAGRPMPPRPLHLQRVLAREITVTEQMDLHLVWGGDRIFIKPLPRYLLEPRFWEEYLPHPLHHVTSMHRPPCVCSVIRQRALGFLFSYVALVAHESDFNFAKASSLLPQEMQWKAWKVLVQELLDKGEVYRCIDRRFYYGELRLSRLNKIYFFWKTPLHGYVPRWNQYGTFLSDNFTILASSTVFIAIVLTAMQVGLATDLQNNAMFKSVSYNFTIFSILGPLVAAGLLIVTFVYLYVWNWIVTKHEGKKILKKIYNPSEGDDGGQTW